VIGSPTEVGLHRSKSRWLTITQSFGGSESHTETPPPLEIDSTSIGSACATRAGSSNATSARKGSVSSEQLL
jgi:hypothetical protein